MTLTLILITSIYQRLGCQHAKVNKTNQLSLCKRGPEYVERGIISSFTMICISEKKSLYYLESRNHPQRTSAFFSCFSIAPSPCLHIFVPLWPHFMIKLWPFPPSNVLYRHSPWRPCLHDYHICTYVQILIEFDCSAIHNAIMNRKSMMK